MNAYNDEKIMPKSKQLVKPSVGIHLGMSESDYFKLDACNASSLGTLRSSNERQSQYERLSNEEDTSIPRRVGRAVHLHIESEEKFHKTTVYNKVALDFYKENENIAIKNTISSSFGCDYTASFKKQTFINKIGIYDENKNLIAIAKMATPVRKLETDEYTFKLKLDL